MDIIERIRSRLSAYPELTYSVEGDRICIEPATASGFSIWLTVNNPGFTVGFDGWHDEFEDEDEALNAFAFGLSDHCRLRVIKRGRTECAWVLESREADKWTADSSTGSMLVPFWKKKSVEYRQNCVIVDREPGEGRAGDDGRRDDER